MRSIVLALSLLAPIGAANAENAFVTIIEQSDQSIALKQNSVVTTKDYISATAKWIDEQNKIDFFTFVVEKQSCRKELGSVYVFDINVKTLFTKIDFVFGGGTVGSTVAEVLCGIGMDTKKAKTS